MNFPVDPTVSNKLYYKAQVGLCATALLMEANIQKFPGMFLEGWANLWQNRQQHWPFVVAGVAKTTMVGVAFALHLAIMAAGLFCCMLLDFSYIEKKVEEWKRDIYFCNTCPCSRRCFTCICKPAMFGIVVSGIQWSCCVPQGAVFAAISGKAESWHEQ